MRRKGLRISTNQSVSSFLSIRCIDVFSLFHHVTPINGRAPESLIQHLVSAVTTPATVCVRCYRSSATLTYVVEEGQNVKIMVEEK